MGWGLSRVEVYPGVRLITWARLSRGEVYHMGRGLSRGEAYHMGWGLSRGEVYHMGWGLSRGEAYHMGGDYPGVRLITWGGGLSRGEAYHMGRGLYGGRGLLKGQQHCTVCLCSSVCL